MKTPLARWLVLLPLLLATSFAACGPVLPDGVPPGSSGSCHEGNKFFDTGAPAHDPSCRGGGTMGPTHNDMPHNDMPHNDMPHNALQAGALAASEDLLWALTQNPLKTETLRRLNEERTPALTEQIVSSRSLLRFIVSCALPPTESVRDPTNPGAAPWKGELGYCGDWSEGRASKQCLQLVSACLLARTNAIGKRVVISVRGEPSCLFPTRDKVPVETSLRENGGTPIPSFQHATECRSGGSERDCGWSPLHVGRCEADSQVTVSVDPAPTDSCTCRGAAASSSDMMLRVCKGLYGCDASAATDTESSRYSGRIPSQCACGERPSVTFGCPRNGPLINPNDDPQTGARYGYYSLMVASRSARTLRDLAPIMRLRAVSNATTPGIDRYPATEKEVFTYPEGAFYGNIFPLQPGQLRQCMQQHSSGAMLSNDAHACYSEIWADPMKILTDRLCAQRDGRCFENTPSACFASSRDHRCAAPILPLRDGVYRDCRGEDAPPWHLPITVYLNHPCDLSSDGTCPIKGKYDPMSPPQEFK
jgi:hypothetical protein